MNENDLNAHPWPSGGKWVELRFRKATWALVRPWYDVPPKFHEFREIRWCSPITFWFPFLTWNIKTKSGWGIHGYMGWKPITLKDPYFYWRDLDVFKKNTGLFVQLSVRGGMNGIG